VNARAHTHTHTDKCARCIANIYAVLGAEWARRAVKMRRTSAGFALFLGLFVFSSRSAARFSSPPRKMFRARARTYSAYRPRLDEHVSGGKTKQRRANVSVSRFSTRATCRDGPGLVKVPLLPPCGYAVAVTHRQANVEPTANNNRATGVGAELSPRARDAYDTRSADTCTSRHRGRTENEKHRARAQTILLTRTRRVRVDARRKNYEAVLPLGRRDSRKQPPSVECRTDPTS